MLIKIETSADIDIKLSKKAKSRFTSLVHKRDSNSINNVFNAAKRHERFVICNLRSATSELWDKFEREQQQQSANEAEKSFMMLTLIIQLAHRYSCSQSGINRNLLS